MSIKIIRYANVQASRRGFADESHIDIQIDCGHSLVSHRFLAGSETCRF